MMRILLSFFLLLVTTSLTFAQPRSRSAKAGPCSCDDRSDLLNRLNELDAAITAYTIAATEGAGINLSVAGNDLPGNIVDLLTRIDAAMRQVREGGKAGKVKGEVGRSLFDCQSELSGETTCFAEVARRHEAVRLGQCERRNAQRKAGVAITLVDFAQDEIEAYKAEQKYILSVMDALICRPKNWFGTVTYTVQFKQSVEANFLWGSKKDWEQKSKGETSIVSSGFIRVGDSIDQSETVDYSEETVSSDRQPTACHEGISDRVGNKKLVTRIVTTTGTTSTKGHDQATKNLRSFNVNEGYPSSLQASFNLGTLLSSVPVKVTSEQTTGCEGKHSSSSVEGTRTVKGAGAKAGGELSSDGLAFSGIQKISRPGLIGGNIKASSSVLTVTWSLHRLPK